MDVKSWFDRLSDDKKAKLFLAFAGAQIVLNIVIVLGMILFFWKVL